MSLIWFRVVDVRVVGLQLFAIMMENQKLPSRYSTLDVIQSFYIVVQVSFKLVCCILSHFKPMHKGLMYFGFHRIIMFKIQAQMKHKNLCFGFNYPIHRHFNFHCHVQVLCALLCSSSNLHRQ